MSKPRKPTNSRPGGKGGKGQWPRLNLGGSSPDGGGPFGGWRFRFSLWYVVILVVALSLFNYFISGRPNTLVDYSVFKNMIRSGEIKRVEMDSAYYTGFAKADAEPVDPFTRKYVQPEASYKTVPVYDPDLISLLDEKGVSYYALSQESGAILDFILSWVLPFAFFFVVWRLLMKRMGNVGDNVLAVGQNRAVIVAEGDISTRFPDVAGVDEAKEELVEVVDFLRNPRKYTEIGGKIPKGVLLVGPPGTGKTLLARAVAGEAGVAFFRMSGADFVELFVGVGAARVRDLFKQARAKAPCIIFIDELDAIGKNRLTGIAGGNDEREQTLNQLLVEMDGFDATSGLIIVAATNRPDVLDPALSRPGRFDRQVLVDRPDLIGREAILRIHAKAVKLAPDTDLAAVARGTPGFVGADLANIVNEAALLAVRNGRKSVSQKDFDEAIEKTVAGLQKKNRVISETERRIVAYHEAGHALVAAFTKGADPVRKISIIPRGFGALGYTMQTPIEDRYILTEDELYGKIDALLGGRAAEALVFERVSTGAANDLTKATDIARRIITDYGMSERFRNVALTQRGGALLPGSPDPFMRREYAESTQQYVDEEIARIMAERFARALRLLSEKKEALKRVAEALLEKESLDEIDFKALVSDDSALTRENS